MNNSYKRPQRKKEEKSEIKQFLLDMVAVLIVLLLIFASLYTYLGRYPFVVVVKSGSMMHGDDSSIGVIDTGDMIFVKKVTRKDDVTTYVEGKEKNFRKFGSYGDVIIYKRNGDNNSIPIIHRAVVWIKLNTSGVYYSYDVPSLSLYNVRERFIIPDYGYRHRDLVIDVSRIFAVFSSIHIAPHSGFITKGDNNLFVDQNSNFSGPVHHILPIEIPWIVGKAAGELPWFGLIKLYLNSEVGPKSGEPVPPTSKKDLTISLIVIFFVTFVLPYIIDATVKRIKKDEDKQDEKEGSGTPPPEYRPPINRKNR